MSRAIIPAVASFVGLALVIGPPIAYLFGALGKESMTTLMLAGTIGWFLTAPVWMPKPGEDSATQSKGVEQ